MRATSKLRSVLWLSALLIGLVGGMSVGVAAQAGAEAIVSGTVTYDTVGPLADVVVTVDGEPDLAATTSQDGTYSLSGLALGEEYTLRVSSGNVELSVVQISVSSESVVRDIEIPRTLRLAYSTELSGEGQSLAEIGEWIESAGTWSIVELDGKLWIQGDTGPDKGGRAYAHIEVPAFAWANKIVVEYTTRATRLGVWGASILGDAPTNNDFGGGKGLMLLRQHSLRPDQRLQLRDGDDVLDDLRVGPIMGGSDIVTFKITYDREARTVSVERNDSLLGYDRDLDSDWLLTDSAHRHVRLFAQDATAQWANLKVWVE